VKVLAYAQELGVLKKRGGVSVDGTKIAANASKHAAVSYGRASEMIAQLEADGGPVVYAAVEKQGHHRSPSDLMERADPPLPPEDATGTERMRHRLRTAAGKAKYALRKQTVAPVFGIIKSVMGFRRFLLRGRLKVSLEWTLVTLAYNFKRLFRLVQRAHRPNQGVPAACAA